jgi:sec-independent protein translocase protein TatB
MIGGLSMTEVIIILGLALLLLGPDQLPQLAKSLGKGLKELRRATDDIKSQFEQEIARVDLNETPRIAPVPPPPGTLPTAPVTLADPGEARAAARRAAADQQQLKLVAPAVAAPAAPPSAAPATPPTAMPATPPTAAPAPEEPKA